MFIKSYFAVKSIAKIVKCWHAIHEFSKKFEGSNQRA